jgi:hypothetical protein
MCSSISLTSTDAKKKPELIPRKFVALCCNWCIPADRNGRSYVSAFLTSKFTYLALEKHRPDTGFLFFYLFIFYFIFFFFVGGDGFLNFVHIPWTLVVLEPPRLSFVSC